VPFTAHAPAGDVKHPSLFYPYLTLRPAAPSPPTSVDLHPPKVVQGAVEGSRSVEGFRPPGPTRSAMGLISHQTAAEGLQGSAPAGAAIERGTAPGTSLLLGRSWGATAPLVGAPMRQRGSGRAACGRRSGGFQREVEAMGPRSGVVTPRASPGTAFGARTVPVVRHGLFDPAA